MKKSAKFLIIIYGNAQTIRKAVKAGCFVSAQLVTEKESELVEAQSVEFDPPKWSDNEPDIEETRKIGFREPKTPRKTPKTAPGRTKRRKRQ